MDFVYQTIDTKAESGARAGQIRYADDLDARSKLQPFQLFLLGVGFLLLLLKSLVLYSPLDISPYENVVLVNAS
jgi:hypothetical protein